jgi:hypothetical protein
LNKRNEEEKKSVERKSWKKSSIIRNKRKKVMVAVLYHKCGRKKIKNSFSPRKRVKRKES